MDINIYVKELSARAVKFLKDVRVSAETLLDNAQSCLAPEPFAEFAFMTPAAREHSHVQCNNITPEFPSLGIKKEDYLLMTFAVLSKMRPSNFTLSHIPGIEGFMQVTSSGKFSETDFVYICFIYENVALFGVKRTVTTTLISEFIDCITREVAMNTHPRNLCLPLIYTNASHVPELDYFAKHHKVPSNLHFLQVYLSPPTMFPTLREVDMFAERTLSVELRKKILGVLETRPSIVTYAGHIGKVLGRLHTTPRCLLMSCVRKVLNDPSACILLNAILDRKWTSNKNSCFLKYSWFSLKHLETHSLVDKAFSIVDDPAITSLYGELQLVPLINVARLDWAYSKVCQQDLMSSTTIPPPLLPITPIKKAKQWPCLVCDKNADANITCLPCQHICFCLCCYRDLMAIKKQKLKCPKCNNAVNKFIVINKNP